MLKKALRVDQQIFLWLAKVNHTNNGARLATAVSKSGDGYCYFMLALGCYCFSPRGEHFFTLILMAFAIELPLYVIIKNAVKRPRPFDVVAGVTAIITPSDKFSLPSGHTAAAMVMATSTLIVYPDYFAASFIWAAAVAISRVVLGVHYPSDLVAGGFLGGSAVYIANLLV
ncbi:phosphatase PAP2 family protein [Paraferrimonas sp. SM1919]|uniref:phosphatase PAP2 family protein n=1 Tax=Paraferrimonas sp. SM1919 TaxID=2662263 RepID=UPI0013D571E3|nr:phosphatase PAP2 family protein [Paraferrimonas sp. SM1919]